MPTKLNTTCAKVIVVMSMITVSASICECYARRKVSRSALSRSLCVSVIPCGPPG